MMTLDQFDVKLQTQHDETEEPIMLNPEQTEQACQALNALVTQSHETAKDKKWWGETNTAAFAGKLLLIHTEVSEAAEQLRRRGIQQSHHKNPKTGLPHFMEELADIVLRTLSVAGAAQDVLPQTNFAKILLAKMQYNARREAGQGEFLDTPTKGLHNL